MRTQEQIREYYDRTRDADVLGFMAEIIVPHLEYSHCRDLLKDSVAAKDWDVLSAGKGSVAEEAREYMARIGWEKVEGHRGISAERTCQKMEVWMWLLGETELEELAGSRGAYPPYGAPILSRICKRFGWPIPDSEAVANMIAGRRCGADYDCGCE